ncbi:MAG: glycosyltransferase, partial [Bacteroidota bacterium]|nr:glycosyltransferase [Bacteroidota bacterium]
MKISVIIVNYKVKHFLELAIASTLRSLEYMNGKNPSWNSEIWVVDNNSSDGSVEMVEGTFPEVMVISNNENTGFSVANNQAIRQSRGEFILLLNPDTVMEESTLYDTLTYMDSRREIGGLGVMMIDGGGNFLPESKRGLPWPDVAFYKISGLSRLFSKSKIFGRYHLGFLDKDDINEVDILPGAFMLLRNEALNKAGLLDEQFFMYGEDVDLSYRIQLAGYQNIYFPKTRIIHYKGESTKKGSLNYVFVFYKAMAIFARKHFSKRNADLFSSFIYAGIYLRAAIAVFYRAVMWLLLPFLDALVLYFFMGFFVDYWEQTIKYIPGGKYYPPELMNLWVPFYILLWMMGLFVSGGYQKPYSFRKIIRGAGIGTLSIITLYAFLDEGHRFSRAIIGFGAVIA